MILINVLGGADQLYVVIETKDVFNESTLAKIRVLTERLKEISGVNQVISLTNLEEIKATADGIDVSPIKSEDLESFKHKILTDEKYVGNFVSSDGQAALMIVKLFVNRDKETVDTIERLVKSFAGPEKFYLSGSPYLVEVIQAGITRDIVRLLPIGIFCVGVILFLSFRTWYGIVFPLLTVFVSSAWAMGFLALLRQPVTVLTSAVPLLLISVGSAYGIHLLSRFEEEDHGLDPKQKMTRALAGTGIAIFVAAATTAVGFLSNGVSRILSIRTFGLVAAFGVMSAFLLTWIWIPAVMAYVHFYRPEVMHSNKKGKDLLAIILDWFGKLITKERSWFFIVTVVVLVVGAFGWPRLVVESDLVKYFRKNSEVMRTAELVKNKFGGSLTLDIVVNGDLKDPELLKKIEKLQKIMKKEPLLTSTYTIVDALKETNSCFKGGNPKDSVIPENRSAVAQYLLLLSMTGSPMIERLIDSNYESALISCRIRSGRSSDVAPLLKRLRYELVGLFGGNFKISGMGAIVQDMNSMLVANQVQSLSLALLLVFLMVLFFYRSWTGAIFCLLPIVITILLNFGIMGWFKIPLDMATAMVASLAVGLGIDYQVHFFNRMKEEMKKGNTLPQAIAITLPAVGKPIIYNAFSVALGFFILIFSDFELLRSFGILVTFTMLFSAFGALAILPDLFMIQRRIERRKKA